MRALQKHASTVYTKEDYWKRCNPFCHWSVCHPELYWIPYRDYINDKCFGSSSMRPLGYVIYYGRSYNTHNIVIHLMSLGARCDDMDYVNIHYDRPQLIESLLIDQNKAELARKLVRSGVLFDFKYTMLRVNELNDPSLVEICKDFDAYVKSFHNNVRVLQLIKGIRHFKRSPERWNLVPREIVDRIIEIAKEVIKAE